MTDRSDKQPRPLLDRWFAALAALVLVTMLSLEISSVLRESQTWDEGIYLAAGYSYWKTGDFRINPEHPPLAKLLSALPLLALHPNLSLTDPAWRKPDQVLFGRDFLYENVVPADTLLFAGRCVTIALTTLLAIVLALWTKRRAGSAAALVALALFAFDPNVIAHGRYATNDIPVAAFAFAAVIALEYALQSGRLGAFAVAGLALGAAIASKYSALFLLPTFAILVPLRTANRRTLLAGIPVMVLLAAAVLLVVALGTVALYVDGVRSILEHNANAQPSYLFGMESTNGWWWYFPVAFLLKSPIGLLLLTATTLVLLVARFRSIADYLALVVPIVVYVVFCLFVRADIGVRYLLPVYPFLFALVGIVCTRYAPKPLVLASVSAVIIESVTVFPNYLAFFNVAVGGPANGPRYLRDSNVDWGQDLEKLAVWLAKHGTHDACISYFGNAPAAYYGIDSLGEPPTAAEYAARKGNRCFTAVSANYLYGWPKYQYLRTMSPVDTVGYSIYVYDLRRGLREPVARSFRNAVLTPDGATYALSGGTLWRLNPSPVKVDSGVDRFWPLDSATVYVLGSDAKLWRDNGNSETRMFVDSDVAAFMPSGDSVVYVLGRDGTLWREHGNGQNRDMVDTGVLRFCAIDATTVHVEGRDRKLWQETSGKQRIPVASC